MAAGNDDWTKPAALVIPKEGYFELERGRYGPVYPRTPACYGFSIIAKVNRDLEIEKLAKEHGELGCGYSHDEKTISFIEKYLEDNDKLPAFARSHWETAQRLEQKRLQQKLV